MLIAKIDGSSVLYVKDYREAFPNVSFPAAGPSQHFLADAGFMRVSLFRPHDTKTEKLVASEPYIDGDYAYTVAIVPKTQEDLDADYAAAAAKVRAQRAAYLAATDWTQLPDAPVDAAVWATYRQALRDVTAQAGFPWDVVWPETPA